MAMEFLTFDDQLMAGFTANDQDNDFIVLDIIQHSQVPGAKFKFRQWIGPQSFNGLRGHARLLLEPRHDGRFDNSLLTRR
jgi:hypothetical protein